MKNTSLLPAYLKRMVLNPMFMTLSVIGWLSFGASASQAEPIIGKLRNHGPERALELVLVKSSRIVTVEARPEIESYLRHLTTGDSISANGRVSNDGTRAFIESLDRVGMQELLGAWRSTSREIFEFQTYDKLNVYIPTVTYDGAVSLAQTRSLKYVLTPEKDNRFSIFMTDQKGVVRLAFIRIENRKLEMTLTDFDTGQPKEKISLSPFFLR